MTNTTIPSSTSPTRLNGHAKSKLHWHFAVGPLSEGGVLALITLLVYGVVSFYFVFRLHYYAGDAASRVGNAYYVLFSRNPHLGAIGMIWNPFPSILELPVVALHPWFPSVVTRALAGNIVTTVLGAIGVYHFNHILQGFLIPKYVRIIGTLAFALDPFIVLYGSNGMTDLMWVTCMIGTYDGLFDYLQTGSLRRLMAAGFWLAAGFGMRYEAVPFGALIIVGLIIAQWGKVSDAQWRGSSVLFGAPIVFAGGLWLYFNWLIMKNPLYFLNSSYGNLAQTATGAGVNGALALAQGHMLRTLFYVAHFGLLYWPIYLGFVVTLFFCFGKQRDPRAIVLIAGTVGAVALELAFVYSGHLAQWDRYFISFIPNGILLISYATSRLWKRLDRLRSFLWILLSVILLSGDVGTMLAVQIPVLSYPNAKILDSAFLGQSLRTTSNPYTKMKSVVQYVNAHPHLTILADTFIDWPIVVRAHHLNQFVITSDYDFDAILHNPRGRVDAFLVPEPLYTAKLDAINRQWPGLWAGTVPWTKLIKSFSGSDHFRLYAILPTAP